MTLNVGGVGRIPKDWIDAGNVDVVDENARNSPNEVPENVVPENAPNFVPENVVPGNASYSVPQNVVPGNAETVGNVANAGQV